MKTFFYLLTETLQSENIFDDGLLDSTVYNV